MSRPWMPFYVGDYLRATGHLTTVQHGAYLLLIMHCWQHGRLPADEGGRAAAARLPLKQWQAIRAPVEAYFQPDGSHKRVDEEIEKTDRKLMQRRLAGQRGGAKSAIARARDQAIGEAKLKRTLEQNLTKRSSENQASATANGQAGNELPCTNHISKIINTFSGTAREGEKPNSEGSLASAPPEGALARPPSPEQAEKKQGDWRGKRPAELTRADHEAMIAERRAPATKSEAAE